MKPVLRRGYGNDPRELREEEIAHVSDYRPRFIPPDQWVPVRAFALDVVLQVAPYSKSHPRNYMSGWCRYVVWAHHVMGTPLQREDVLDRELIAYYAMNALQDHVPGSRGAIRSRLLWFADHVLPPDQRAMKLERVGRNPATEPYNAQQVRGIKMWAGDQPTPYKRHAMWTIATFGLGAGLQTRELAEVRREHVSEDEHGVQVEVVSGDSPRVVPLLAEWEDHAVVLAECVAPGAYVFLADRNKPRPDDIGWSIGKSHNRPNFPVNLQRMRLTWYVRLLNAGCPVPALLKAAGLESLDAISRVVRFLDEVPAQEAREHLRSWNNARVKQFRTENREYWTWQKREAYAARQAFRRGVSGR